MNNHEYTYIELYNTSDTRYIPLASSDPPPLPIFNDIQRFYDPWPQVSDIRGIRGLRPVEASGLERDHVNEYNRIELPSSTNLKLNMYKNVKTSLRSLQVLTGNSIEFWDWYVASIRLFRFLNTPQLERMYQKDTCAAKSSSWLNLKLWDQKSVKYQYVN